MVESLEQRLRNIDKSSLKEVLLAPKILPRERMEKIGYFKYDITDCLGRYFREKNVVLREKPKTSVSENLYSTIRKEPLKQVQYGMINSENISDDVFKTLTDWEAIYFLAGVWNKKSTLIEGLQYNRGLLERQPVELIIAETITAGIYRLRNIHEKQRYRTQAELPYSKEILERYYELRQKFISQSSNNKEQEKPSGQLKLF